MARATFGSHQHHAPGSSVSDSLPNCLLGSMGCPYQKLYPCGFSGVSEGEIRMGLRPKIPEMPLEGKRVPGRIPFVAVRLGVLRLPAARNDDASHRPATIQLPFPRRWLDRARNRRVFCQGQMSARSFVIVEIQLQNATQTAFVEDEDVVETVTPDRAD